MTFLYYLSGFVTSNVPLSVLHKHVPKTVLKRQCRPVHSHSLASTVALAQVSSLCIITVHSHSLASTVALAQFELALLLQLLTGYEPCTLTQLAVGSTHLEGLSSATALKSSLISPLCKLFLLLGKSGKFWDLCLGKQGAWLVLQSLSIGLEVVHPSLLLVRHFPSTLYLLGAEESLILQEQIIQSGPNLDDRLYMLSTTASQSCMQNS